MFTKEQISRMREEEFQNNVLIPLFRNMKFREVTTFGGGSLELGKDIVMWKEGDVGERVNYGVVVKAVRISGKAKGKDSASEVLNQIRQCLTSEYPDPVTGQTQRIHRCFIVSSQIIEKAAMNSISSQLRDFHFDKLLVWIHPGTNLYQLIDKYLPEQNVFEKLKSVQENLDDAMKIVPYRIVADTDKNFTFLPKHEKAFEEMPFTLKTKLNFDTTAEGLEALEKFRKQFAEGARVEIEGKFIESFDLPDFIPEWLKPRLSADSKLILEPHRSEGIIPLYFLKRVNNEEDTVSETFNFEHINTIEGFTFVNDRQSTPLQCKIVFNLKTNTARFDFSYRFFGYNVYQHLQALRFYTSLSRDGKMEIYRADIGLQIPLTHQGKLELQNNFERELNLLEDLVLIQNTFSVPLNLAGNNLDNEVIKSIFEVAEIIKKGKLTGKVSEFTTNVPLESATKVIKGFENEHINSGIISYPEGWKYNILGNEINVGVAVISTNFFVDGINFKQIEKDIAASKDIIDFVLKPENGDVTVDFISWKCADRDKRVHIIDKIKER